MPSKNAERLKVYKARMKEAGFHRISAWVHPDLVDLMTAERKAGECAGRELERMLLGQAKQRPPYYDIEIRTSTRDACAQEGGTSGARHTRASNPRMTEAA
jgi:hypothetical protein